MIEPIDPPEPLEEEYRAWQEQNAPSSCTVDSIVRNMWNHFADGYNQWGSLGQDEKDTLFKIAVANAHLTGPKGPRRTP